MLVSPGLAELFVGLSSLLASNKATTALMQRRLARMAAPGASAIPPCEITLLLLERARFLTSLDQEAEGIRYRGVGCVLLWLKPFTIGPDEPKSVTVEYLYRTPDNFDFLLKGSFSLAGPKDEAWKFSIESMSRHEARQWAHGHAGGRDVSHI